MRCMSSVCQWRWRIVISADPNITDLLQGEHPKILAVIEEAGGVWKNVDFLALSVNISKTVADTAKVTISD